MITGILQKDRGVRPGPNKSWPLDQQICSLCSTINKTRETRGRLLESPHVSIPLLPRIHKKKIGSGDDSCSTQSGTYGGRPSHYGNKKDTDTSAHVQSSRTCTLWSKHTQIHTDTHRYTQTHTDITDTCTQIHTQIHTQSRCRTVLRHGLPMLITRSSKYHDVQRKLTCSYLILRTRFQNFLSSGLRITSIFVFMTVVLVFAEW